MTSAKFKRKSLKPLLLYILCGSSMVNSLSFPGKVNRRLSDGRDELHQPITGENSYSNYGSQTGDSHSKQVISEPGADSVIRFLPHEMNSNKKKGLPLVSNRKDGAKDYQATQEHINHGETDIPNINVMALKLDRDKVNNPSVYGNAQQIPSPVNEHNIDLQSHSGDQGQDYGEFKEASDMVMRYSHGLFVDGDNVPNHNDKFQCPPCECSHTVRGKIAANCTVQNLTEIPYNLPVDTWRLNISETKMKTFNSTGILKYPFLSSLIVTKNQNLRYVRNGSVTLNQSSLITHLDLSSNDIHSIDDRSFVLMPNLLNLTLRHNKLKNITNATFQGLENLRTLDLSMNDFFQLKVGCFYQLNSLRTLDLSGNDGLGYSEKRFPPLLFTQQQHLRQLLIQGNDQDEEQNYPNKVIQDLVNLQELYIDGMGHNIVFGPQIKDLKYFKHLEMGTSQGKCFLKKIDSSFFDNLPHLEVLKLSFCPLRRVSPNAYSNAAHLKMLSISSMANYDLFTALEDLESLQTSSLKSLSLVRLFHRAFPCRVLRKEQSKYLKHIELEELDLSNNRLSLLDNEFCAGLPRTLKRLILKENRFTFTDFILKRIFFLENLIEINLTNQNYFAGMLSSTDETICSSDSMIQAADTNEYAPELLHLQIKNNTNNTELDDGTLKTSPTSHTHKLYNTHSKTGSTDLSTYSMDGNHGIRNIASYTHVTGYSNEGLGRRFKLPPNLRILKAAKFCSSGMGIFSSHLSENSLSEIDFSDSYLSEFDASDSMPVGVRTANLNGNYLKHISPMFFKLNSSLVHLSLRNNVLGSDFALDEEGLIFARLKNTVYLNLSDNMIYKLPHTFFQGLTSLRSLIISDNKLDDLNTSFSQMTFLSYLDLSKNSIAWISKRSRDDLDKIGTMHRLSVDLTKNPLPCTCVGLEVLYWMSTTNVYLLDKDYLYCRFDNGDIALIGDIEDRVRSLQRHCASKAFIIFSCLASFVFMAILSGFAIMYRYRWKLRYLRHVAMARFLGFKPRESERNGRKFDAYFLYTETSRNFVLHLCRHELEVKRGHRLCLDERDFMPGTFSVSNITSAIQNSTKTVAVITPDFYEEDYSEYGIKMALHEEMHERRSTLYLCVYQPMPDDEIAQYHDLLMVMKRNDYTEFPPEEDADEEIRQNFWDRLSQAIGHSGDNDGAETT